MKHLLFRSLFSFVLSLTTHPLSAEPDATSPQPPATPRCKADLRIAWEMRAIISNVLTRAEHKPESEVNAFLEDAVRRSATGDDLLKAAAEHFKIDQKRLAALVEHWRHINCKHAAIPGCGGARGRFQPIGPRQLDRSRIGNRWRQDFAASVNRAISFGANRFRSQGAGHALAILIQEAA